MFINSNMLYLLRHVNYKDEVYDLLISNNKQKNYNVIKIMKVYSNIEDIRLLLDPNEHTTYIKNNNLYLQSGLVDIELLYE